MKEESALHDRINQDARTFGFAIDPKNWKSRTPIHRMDGYKAGASNEIKRALILIDQTLQEKDCESLKELRRKILSL